MSDLLTVADLEAAKKHDTFHSEVISGKAGGVAGGADIDYATNQVTGQVQKTMPAVLRDIGVERIGDFTTGCTVTARNQGVLEVGGSVYIWLGTLPKVVPAASTPGATGGIYPSGDWLDVGDASLRGEIQVATYTELRSYGGTVAAVYVTGAVGSVTQEGIAGYFTVDPADTTSADNGGTTIVDSLGRRWKRQDLGPVNIEWFGASTSSTDNITALTAAMTLCKTSGRAFYVPGRGALTYKFSGTLYPNGVVMFGDGEMDSCLQYTGSGTAISGDGATGQELFDFILRDASLIGPGKAVAGTIGVDGDMYRNNWSGYTITNFEIGVQARGAIAHLGMGRVAGCKWGVVVRPYRNCLPTTTVTISASVDNCEDGIWVDHIYNATPVWPQTSGFGGAAAIVFRDTVVEKCSGVAYKVNRAATVVFDNAYQEQNGKAYEIISSTNPIFLTPLNGFGSAAGTITYTGQAEVDQGYTANELFGTTLHHLFVGGQNAKGGVGDPFMNTVAGRGVRSYLSGCAAFIKDPLATTQDAFWIGNAAAPKKYQFSIDDTTNHWLRLNSYTDAGTFSQTGFVFDQVNGRWSFGTGEINTNFRASFNGPIGPVFDNLSSLGVAAFRWSVVYAGTGTINTSDAREKSDPKPITDVLLDAADSIEIVLFQWLDAIREKGEDLARWHFGPIAQQIRDAFEAKGLDGRRYGLLCYDKWEDEWEPVIEEVIEHSTVKKEDGSDEVIETSRFVDTGEKRLKIAAGDRWGVRPDQCHWLLLAAARRRAQRAEERISAIERHLGM